MELGEVIGRGRSGEVYEYGTDQVLKLFYMQTSKAWVEHEYRVSQIIQQEPLPIARVYEIVEINDRIGIVYERITGKTLLNHLFTYPDQMEWIAETCAEVLSRIHQCNNVQLPSQRDSIIERIKQADIPADWKEQALHLLSELPDGSVVCHGDYHPDNIIHSSSGPIVIDWSAATSGNASADFVRSVLILQIATAPEPEYTERFNLIRDQFLSLFEKAYMKRVKINTAELDHWFIVVAIARLLDGIASEKEQLLQIISEGFKQLNGGDHHESGARN